MTYRLILRCSRQAGSSPVPAACRSPAHAALGGTGALHPPRGTAAPQILPDGSGTHHRPPWHRLLAHAGPARSNHSKELLRIRRGAARITRERAIHPAEISTADAILSPPLALPLFSSLSFPPSPKSSLSPGSAEEADLLKINSFCFDLVYGHALFIAPCVRLDTFPPAAPTTASYHSHFGY